MNKTLDVHFSLDFYFRGLFPPPKHSLKYLFITRNEVKLTIKEASLVRFLLKFKYPYIYQIRNIKTYEIRILLVILFTDISGLVTGTSARRRVNVSNNSIH